MSRRNTGAMLVMKELNADILHTYGGVYNGDWAWLSLEEEMAYIH